jgi:hypothetical protein
MMTKPGLLLQVEGAAVLGLACVLYQHLHGSWPWFTLLFLSPDLFMLGYLANKKTGAIVYNLGHTYTVPVLLLLAL